MPSPASAAPSAAPPAPEGMKEGEERQAPVSVARLADMQQAQHMPSPHRP